LKYTCYTNEYRLIFGDPLSSMDCWGYTPETKEWKLRLKSAPIRIIGGSFLFPRSPSVFLRDRAFLKVFQRAAKFFLCG
ncbi:MAG: hypothetical protein ACYTEM_05920, partial [Planctomycetota bacterium]